MGLRRAIMYLGCVAALLTFSTSASAQTEPLYEQGLKPYGSFQGGSIDSVSLATQKLSLHIPLVSYSQRGGKLHVGFFINYTNGAWTSSTISHQGTATQVFYRSLATPGSGNQSRFHHPTRHECPHLQPDKF